MRHSIGRTSSGARGRGDKGGIAFGVVGVGVGVGVLVVAAGS